MEFVRFAFTLAFNDYKGKYNLSHKTRFDTVKKILHRGKFDIFNFMKSSCRKCISPNFDYMLANFNRYVFTNISQMRQLFIRVTIFFFSYLGDICNPLDAGN